MDNIEIGALIKRISIQLRLLADFDMKEFDLTWSQVHVLHHLSKHDGMMTQKELEKELGIAHPTMVGLVKRLESKGFIETKTSETDHRMKIVRATDRAESHKQYMQERMNEKEQVMTQGISAEDAELLRRCLQTVYQNLTRYREEMQVNGRWSGLADSLERTDKSRFRGIGNGTCRCEKSECETPVCGESECTGASADESAGHAERDNYKEV